MDIYDENIIIKQTVMSKERLTNPQRLPYLIEAL